MAVPYHTHTFEIPVASDAEAAAGVISNKVIVPSNLGTAAIEDASAFATAAQGALADSSVQPADLATVATSGAYADLSGKPTLGTAAAANVTDFATAAQGATADTALQPADIGVDVASAAQGVLADSAVQPGDLAPVATTGAYSDLTGAPALASQAEAVAATDNAKTMTALRVGETIDGRTTQIAGAGSSSRTQPARFGDTLDIKEFGFDVSGADASAAANNDAIDRMIAHATANPGMTYRGRKGDVIRITAIGKTFPANTTLYMNGGRFRWSGDISGSASNVLTFGPGFRGDIGFEPVSGSNWRRLLLFNGGTVGSTIEQVDLVPEVFSGIFNNNFDAAIKTDGNNVQIGTLNISKCYIGYMHRGLNGAAFDTGLKIGYLDIKEYGKIGGILQNVDLWLAGYNIREQGTVGLPPDPGYNALQTASISGYIGGGTLANAPEHNYRDGGPASGERITRDLTIQGMTSKNAGQCCFKMFTGVDTTGYYRNITLANISAFNPRARAGAGGFNDFGFMLQQMVDSRAHGLSCIVEGGNPKAGMYVSGADNLQIDGYQFRQSSGIAASNAI